MRIDLDTIMLGVGLNEIPFGCSVDYVKVTLGTPSSEEVDEFGDLSLEYSLENLRFKFWCEEDFRLGVISSERPSANLKGMQLYKESKDEIKAQITKNLVGKISEQDGCIHENGTIQEWIEVDGDDVSFWFEDNKLYLIEWTCHWSDDGNTPIWSNAPHNMPVHSAAAKRPPRR